MQQTSGSETRRARRRVRSRRVRDPVPVQRRAERELEVSRARDGGGGGGGERGGFVGDGKEEARKERLMTSTSKSGEGNVGSNWCSLSITSGRRNKVRYFWHR